VTRPVGDTATIDGSPDSQPASPVIPRIDPSENVAVAVNCVVSPTAVNDVLPDTTMVTATGASGASMVDGVVGAVGSDDFV
jgi:hypothetical protein